MPCWLSALESLSVKDVEVGSVVAEGVARVKLDLVKSYCVPADDKVDLILCAEV
mgnify:CR=1 FL=1